VRILTLKGGLKPVVGHSIFTYLRGNLKISVFVGDRESSVFSQGEVGDLHTGRALPSVA
jgi:hypothetical protein